MTKYIWKTGLLFLFFLPILPAQNIGFQADPLNFPASWQGEWAGELEIFNASGKVQSVPMELHILPIDTSENYTWTIIYGEDKATGKRPYELQTIDESKGLYVIDEKNTIALEAYLLNGKLYSRFEVMGSLLLSTQEKVGDQLLFEIISGSMEPASTTGGEKWNGEDIPEVNAFPIRVQQKAVLKLKTPSGH